MKSFFTRQSGFLLMLIGTVALGALLAYLFTSNQAALFPTLSAKSTATKVVKTTSTSTIVPVTPTPYSQPCVLKQNFEMGLSFPQWTATGYSADDTKWLTELPQMRQQTAACWVSMPILFDQSSLTSTTVTTTRWSTPTIAAFMQGVRYAHELGLHVFVTPLVHAQGSQSWAGSIYFSTYEDEQAWFTSYWQAIKPYVQAAAQLGVEQIAIGTELEWLQRNAPADLWNGLIANIRSEYQGSLTYDINWTSLQDTPPSWMHNPALKCIGVSAYLPILTKQERVDPSQMSALWQTNVKQQLDNFSIALGEPILISEIGYRNSADALYHSWETTSSMPADPEEQAGAYDATLTNIIPDPHILGVFFWGWDDTGSFAVKGQKAASVLHTHYSALQA